MNGNEKQEVKKLINNELSKLFYTLFKKKSFWQS